MGEKRPDQTLKSTILPLEENAPQVYAVVDLRPYLKPEMDEELTSPEGEPAVYGTETVCGCVPVEDCACNTVSHFVDGDSCPSHCSCVGHGGGGGVYWYPY